MPRIKKQDVLSVKDFAALLKISATSVTRHIRAGNITERSIQYSLTGKPKILVDYAMEDMQRRPPGPVRTTKGGTVFDGNLTKPEARSSPVPTPRKVEEIVENLSPEIDQNGNVTVNGKSLIDADGIMLDFSRDPASLPEAKVREAIAKAVGLEISNQEKRKTLVNKAEHDRQFAGFAVNLKNDLGTVADRLAAILATTTSATECRNLVHREIENILTKHSKKWPK